MRKSDNENNERYGSDIASWREIFQPQYRTSLALTCFGIWLHASDSLIVATMMPSIVKEIRGEEFLSWTLSLYEIGSIVAGAAGAQLTMRNGLRLSMFFASLLFALGCMVSALAPDMIVVLIGRLLQGLGGGALLSMSYISVNLLFPARLSARVIAALSALWGTAAFTGPLIGGIFAEYDAWRFGFLFFALKALILAVWIFLSGHASQSSGNELAGHRFPMRRLLVLSSSIIFISLAGINTQSWQIFLLIFSGSVCLFLFFHLDNRESANRLFPHNTLSLKQPIGSMLTGLMLLSASTVAIAIYGPLLMTGLHNVSALTAGYVLAAGAIGWAAAAIIFSGSPEKYDPVFIITGAILITLSSIGMLYSIPNGPVWLIALFETIQGAGFGMAWTFILRKATAMAPTEEAERIASAMPTIQRMGFALGAAFIGIIANTAGLDINSDKIEMSFVAQAIFSVCIPAAFLGLYGIYRFVNEVRLMRYT